MNTSLNNEAANRIEVETEMIEFSIEKVKMFNAKFKLLNEAGIIKNKFFSDITWTLENNYTKEGYTSNITFDLEDDIHIYNLILKCLLLSRINDDNESPLPETIITRYKYLKDIIQKTNGFNIENIDQFEEYIESIYEKSSVVLRIIAGLNDLDSFYELDYMEDYIDKAVQFSDTDVGTRARRLPKFRSIIIFNHQLKRVFPTLTRELKKKFYPLYLWWEITMIIPLRPSEFLKLKSNCCWKDEKNRYWIKVPRSKVRDKKSKIKLVYELETNKKTYDMIQEYKEFLSEEFDIREYLMPYELYKSCFSQLSIGNSNKRRKDKEKLTPNDGNSLLRQFYQKYINCEDGYENVEQLRLGDSRHFAFCNMILQGFNGLTIAQIGGHTTLNAQIHYYQQLNTCADAYVGELADRIYLSREKIYDSATRIDKKEYISNTYLALTPENTVSKLLEIENGYCTIKYKEEVGQNFDKCLDECYDCDFHILNLKKYPFVRKKLQDRSSKLGKILQEQIEVLVSISKDILIDYSKKNVDFISNKKLKEIGTSIKDIINKKAKVDSYLLDYIVKENFTDGIQ